MHKRLGLNMHPDWLGDGAAEDFLLPLRELGLGVLEFTLDLSSPDWPRMDRLIEECHRLGFRLTFHAPYKGLYNPAGFSGAEREKIERLYRPAIAYAAQMAAQRPRSVAEGACPEPSRRAAEAESTILVVHAAKRPRSVAEGTAEEARAREELRRDTRAFLAWIVAEFPSLHPVLELLVRDAQVNKIGDNKPELVEIVSALDSARVGICWDLGHDARNGCAASPPGFIAWVQHVHLHDISPEGLDHCPLLFGNVPYAEHVRQLNGAGYQGAIILEVNGRRVARFAARAGLRPVQVLHDDMARLGRLMGADLRVVGLG